MNITYITDEATQDPKEFIGLAKKYNINALELRSVNNKNVAEMPVDEVKQLNALLTDNGINVCCLDSFVFKSDLFSDFKSELDKLKIALQNADVLGTNNIRIFSFLRKESPEKYFDEIAERLTRAGELCKGTNVTLSLENCRRAMTCTALELKKYLDVLDNNVFSALWDPANSLFCEMDLDPVGCGYELIKDKITHIHVKDPYLNNGKNKYVTLGQGCMDWHSQLKKLKLDFYKGYISLETHWRPDKAMDLKEFDLPGGEHFSKNGYEATERDLIYMKKMISKVD